MPRPEQTLPEREKEICHRVRIARMEIIKWSQPDLAKEMGITQNQLSGIEYARAPLRLAQAKLLCERFNISQRWLALGTLPRQPSFDVPIEYSYTQKPNTLFSQHFDGFLDVETAQIEAAVTRLIGMENYESGKSGEIARALSNSTGDMPDSAKVFLAKNVVAYIFEVVPLDLRVKFADGLLRLYRDFQSKHAKVIDKIPEAREVRNFLQKQIIPKTPLTAFTLKSKPPDVKSEIQKLIGRLKHHSSRPGSKIELAQRLGVAPARISEWLSGEKEPGGEYALQLLNWVQEQERQK